MEIIQVVINCPSNEVAQAISSALIEQRIAASTNIYGGITSAYHWKGRVERAGEVALWLKTRGDLFEAVVIEAKKLHPYETPSIVGTALPYVNSDYKDWIVAETASADFD